MSLKRTWGLLITLVVISLMVGCYGGETDAVNEKGDNAGTTTEIEKSEDKRTGEKVLKVATAGELPTIRTNGNLDGLSQTVMLNIYEGLFMPDENSKLTNGIAEDYEFNEDDLTYTFYLREDALWTNGEPTTAHDFVYAWKKAMNPDTFSPHAYLMAPIVNASEIQNKDHELYGQVEALGVKAIDNFTLEVKLENNVPYFLELLTNPVFFPQNQDFVETQGEKYGLEPENAIYNGAFYLDTWNHDQGWVLKKYEDYWDSESVKIDAVEYKVAKDTSTEVNLYETDEIDVANLSSEFVDMFSEHEEYSTSLNSEVYFVRFNLENEHLNNVNIRKAIDMAYDKQQIVDVILKNGSLPAYFLIPNEYVFSPEGKDFRDKHGDLNKTNIEEAQEYWQTGLAELGVNEISIEMLSYDDGQRKSVAEFMKNQLESNLRGLTVSINQQPNKQKLDLEGKQNYDMSFSGWRSDIGDAVDLLDIYLSTGRYNWQSFSNEEYDQIITKANNDFTDLNQRFTELQRAEQILIEEEAVISPIYQSSNAKLIKPYVNGYVAHPNNTISYKWVSID